MFKFRLIQIHSTPNALQVNPVWRTPKMFEGDVSHTVALGAAVPHRPQQMFTGVVNKVDYAQTNFDCNSYNRYKLSYLQIIDGESAFGRWPLSHRDRSDPDVIRAVR